MPTIQRTRQVTYEIIQCYRCGVDIAGPDGFLDQRRKDGQSFWCLNGHSQGYQETEEQRLKKKLTHERERAASAIAQLDQERASHSSTKGQLTKARKRAQNGVCPCCHRSFVQLARHIKTQHPKFDPDG